MNIDVLIEKVENFDSLIQKDKVKIIGYFFCTVNNKDSFTASDIRMCFEKLCFEVPGNLSRELSALTSNKPPILIRKSNNYSFQRSQKKQLDDIYLPDKHVKEVSSVLRSLLPKTKTEEQRLFLAEAIACFEIKSYRASIIMTWLLVMDILLEHSLAYSINDFNDELKKRNKKKTIAKKTDFEDYKESEIIEIMRAAGVISKEQKKLLDDKLDIRNSAAHPNVTTFREPKVITFIQELFDEIIAKF